MRKILLLILGFFLLSSDVIRWSYIQKDDTAAKVKAVYLYNFTRYFEWPTGMREGNFIITTVGTNAGLQTELSKLAKTKKVNNQSIEVKTSTTIADAGKCNILYLLGDNSSLLADAIKQFKGKGTLVICEKSGMARAGATINFITSDNKQTFELNNGSVQKSNLKVSADLKLLAKTVYE
ncbi:MAG: YfiR family protein [Bacteroidota bacterium]|jgi:Fe-S cluster assembly iron-binding protein IscA